MLGGDMLTPPQPMAPAAPAAPAADVATESAPLQWNDGPKDQSGALTATGQDVTALQGADPLGGDMAGQLETDAGMSAEAINASPEAMRGGT